ncbi:hypothetical protein BOTNAR_0251g00100 [Botryotinia narcissicola]|uniref:Heterokaryon incompatibility domain-containing protein n=1 Tax=Botryotinia narcissicola TaxID=278944 RepID=A0A4Z1I359_9HELO|nr:hypothetical protein BOTNAR_0251g00100 [Botryotinia narcissicola]
MEISLKNSKARFWPAVEKLDLTLNATLGESLLPLDKPTPMVNWNTVTEWLKTCDRDNHISSPHERNLNHLKEFRVIDTKRRCVVSAPQACKLAALSYVWGNGGSFLQATTKIIQRLGLNYSLRDKELLLATIDDAINVCGHLNIPFLWVDRICILQDETQEKKAIHLAAMGEIYNCSYITLVAMAGKDTNYGLPGVDGRNRAPQWSGTTQGIYLFEPAKTYVQLLHDSIWQTRGWTFQEAILAQRLLLFSDRGVFYECNGQCLSEGESGEGVATRQESAFSAPDDLRYFLLNAFSGIMHNIYGARHHFGLPLHNFSRALWWKTVDGRYPSRADSAVDFFPSWSWSSVTNSIQLDCYTWDWRDTCGIAASLAQWAIPTFKDKKISLLVLPSSWIEWRIRQIQGRQAIAQRLILLAWKKGCFPGKLPEEFDSKATWEEYDALIKKRWDNLGDMCDEAHSVHRKAQEDEWERVERGRFPKQMQKYCTDKCILVHTQSQLVYVKLTEKNEENYVLLRNGKDDIIGWLEDFATNWEFLSDIQPEKDRVELYALALSIPYRVTIRSGPGLPVCQETSEHETKMWADSEWKHLVTSEYLGEYSIKEFQMNLMVVWTDHNNISKRVALAKAYLKTWAESKPKFNTFILG